MLGSKSGVGGHINELEQRANVVHCQAYSLNLVVQDAASKVSLRNTFMSNVNDMLNFVRASPRRLAELANIAVEFAIDQSLRPLCPAR